MTKQIPLTQSKVVLVDDQDYAEVSQYKWYLMKKKNRVTQYATRTEQRADGSTRCIWMHRFILNAPPGLEVDHIDHDGLNCTRANMRLCTRAENMRNRRSYANNTTGYKGVSFHIRVRRFRAHIRVNNKQHHLGYHDTADAAAKAYDEAARELHGEFALTNEDLGLY